MAKKMLKSNLLKKLGSAGKKAIEAHKNDEVVLPDGSNLPGGIDFGVAQLVDCKFDTYKKGDNKGEFFFFAAGIVVEPKKLGNITIEGLRTQITEPATCDTPTRSRKTVDDHIQWIMNQMRLLGADDIDENNLEEVAEALKEEKPYFRFETWKSEPTPQFPNPRVNHKWCGVTEFIEEESEESEDVIDETEDNEDDNDDESNKEKTSDTVDLIALGEKADKDDEDAQSELTDLAETAGLDPESYEFWLDLAKDLKNNVSTDDDDDEQDSEDDEEEEETIIPEKGEVYKYKPPKKRKPIDCDVTAVFLRKETCNLVSLDDRKIFKSVPFAKLIRD